MPDTEQTRTFKKLVRSFHQFQKYLKLLEDFDVPL